MTSIITLLNEIESDQIVLPAIQRDFVWDENQIERLFDSIMRGYPIGIALLWDTHEDIQYRSFQKDFRPGNVYTYRENPERRRLKLVLDGQQRLQSLYVSLYGSRDGKELYFDVLSGHEGDDVSEERFVFYFLTRDEAEGWHVWAHEEAANPEAERDDDFPMYPMKVSELFSMGARDRRDLVRKLGEQLALSDEDVPRLDLNLATLDEVLTRDQNIIKASTIDENLPAASPNRKTEADVLEIFVRINREGTPLSRSDLIFSMLKLNWKESTEALPEFVRNVNRGNSFSLDTDFVVRCLFAVSDLGSRLDLDVLRKRTNIAALRQNFGRCTDAIRAAVDFVQTECKCASSSLLGGANTLVPFVYYFSRLPRHDVPNAAVEDVRSALYACALARPFSRYADSRIGAFIRSELKPGLDAGETAFPLSSTIASLKRWERVGSLGELAERNVPLTLHLVQGLAGQTMQYSGNSPEIDHIFPRSELRKKGYAEEQVNHFANFWILARGKNRNKSNRHPRDYFLDVSQRHLREALIAREMLDYRRYPTFFRTRQERVIAKLAKTIHLTDADFV